MLSSKNVATIAIVAIALTVGAAAIVAAVGQVTYATNMEPPIDRMPIGKENACRLTEDKPPFCDGVIILER